MVDKTATLAAIAGERDTKATGTLSGYVRRGTSAVLSAYAVRAGSFLGVLSEGERDALPAVEVGDHLILTDIESAQVQQGAEWVDSSKVLSFDDMPQVIATEGLWHMEFGGRVFPIRLTDGVDTNFYVDKDGNLYAKGLSFGNGALLDETGVEVSLLDVLNSAPNLRSALTLSPASGASTGVNWGTPVAGDARMVSVSWTGAPTLTSAGGMTIAVQRSVAISGVTVHLALAYKENCSATPTTDTLTWSGTVQSIHIHAEMWANVAVVTALDTTQSQDYQPSSPATQPSTGTSAVPGSIPSLAFASVAWYDAKAQTQQLAGGFTTQHHFDSLGSHHVTGWKVQDREVGVETHVAVAAAPWIAELLVLQPLTVAIRASASDRALIFAAARGDSEPSLFVVGPTGNIIDLGHGGVAAVEALQTIVNTAVQADVLSVVIPAGALKVGTTYTFEVFGDTDNRSATTDNLEFRMVVNSTVVTTHSVAPPDSTAQTNKGYVWRGQFVVREHGTSGVIATASHVTTAMAATEERYQQGDTITVDTTAQVTLKVQLKWNNANASNEARVETGVMQRVYN